jgi:hypothetical protein
LAAPLFSVAEISIRLILCRNRKNYKKNSKKNEDSRKTYVKG